MNIRKTLGIAIIGASIVGQQLAGSPLKESQIAKDAKWLAHVDVEALMQSPLGGMLAEQLKTEIARSNTSKISIDVDMVLAEVKSLTAYGTKFEEGGDMDAVIVLETGNKLPAILDGFLAHETLTKGEEASFKLLEDKPYTTYLVGDELYVANPKPNLIVASKSFDEIEKAYAVVEGDAPNLTKSKSKLVLNDSRGFFLVASASGLDQLKDLPPQARVLQKTTGGQFSIGQDGSDFRANVILAAATPTVSQQLFRIVQGMVALVSFTQVENQGMANVMDRVQVTQSEDRVSIDFRYPMDEVMNLLRMAVEDNWNHHGGSTDNNVENGDNGADESEKPEEAPDAGHGSNDRAGDWRKWQRFGETMESRSEPVALAFACGHGKGE